ncbi:MAG: integrase [Betaproteobacteria bacterium RIFCSPLOWO2_12_FULL_63_13]|nr:MAG: integrase [Betaproteobacteria bacterium RIFCSPLOWO2_12_FULL_63_13]
MSRILNLRARVRQYLRERRRLGFALRTMGYALRSLAAYAQDRRPLTLEVMAEWARRDRAGSSDPRTWARRLKLLRPFLRWLQQFEPRTEVPEDAIFGRVGERTAPHIYTEQEIVDLLVAARRIGPCNLRGATYETLFGLLACTGLRVSEAVRLQDRDVDLKNGILTVRRTKFAKSRQVPLHPSTTQALQRCRRLRDSQIEVSEDTPLFVGWRGRRRGQMLSTRQVDRVFRQLRTQLGWPNRGTHAAPRVHDLRHTFVVRRLLAWHADGTDIDQAMLGLSTYVGHAMVTNTYWYLSAVPELMGLAAKRFEAFQRNAEATHA